VSEADRSLVDPEEQARRAKLLNGPALDGPETSQDAIDALFDAAPSGQSSQAEIDSLFS
jgi:chemotaxis protein CheZ